MADGYTVGDFIGDLAGARSLYYGNQVGQEAAADAADATLKAAEIAAEAARFKPYSVATGFGTSFFDPETGRATYAIDPALAAYRDQYLQGAADVLPTEFGTPQQQAQDYYSQLMGQGGTAADIANRYAQYAGSITAPTDYTQAFAGVTAPSYQNLNQYYAGAQQPSYMNLSNAYAGVGGGPSFYNNANMFSGINTPYYANQAQGISNQYTQAGADLLGQGTASAGDLYEQIRELQRPEEERARSQMEQGLFGSGRLGMRSAQYGGTPEQLAFEKAMGESKNQAAYQAISQADQLAASQRQQAMSLSGMGLSAEQQANAMRQMGYQDVMGLRAAQMGARQDANTMAQQAYMNQVNRAGLGLQARQAENLQRQQAFQDYMGIQGAQLGAGQAQNQMLTQQYANQMGLGQANLAALQAQAGLFGEAQSGALSAFGNQLQTAQGMRTGAMGELDQAIARGTGLFQTGTGVEQLGMMPLEYGMQMGGLSSTAGANVGKSLLSGGISAANANLAAGVNQMNMFRDFGLSFLND